MGIVVSLHLLKSLIVRFFETSPERMSHILVRRLLQSCALSGRPFVLGVNRAARQETLEVFLQDTQSRLLRVRVTRDVDCPQFAACDPMLNRAG